MRILYVSHTAEVSGGERSLLDLLRALRASVQARVATPHGRLEQELGALPVATSPIAGTSGSLRPHPVHTPVTIAQLALSAVQVRRAARHHRAELLHANSIRAGIIVGLARARGQATVVHVRDCLPESPLSTVTLRMIGRTASTVVANSSYTAASVLRAAPGARVDVVHNAVDSVRFDPAVVDRAAVRAGLTGVGEGVLLLGVVAQLTPWKGQDTAIRALAMAREQGVDAHLVLIGSTKFLARATRFDNEAYARGLRDLARELGVAERVSWLGEREDVVELIGALDLLLAPSWEEPFGRAVLEGMALEVPVIATNVGGPAEIIRDGREGVLLPPREPALWARAIAELSADPARRARIGSAGRMRAQQDFSMASHVAAMMDVYARSLVRRGAPWRLALGRSTS